MHRSESENSTRYMYHGLLLTAYCVMCVSKLTLKEQTNSTFSGQRISNHLNLKTLKTGASNVEEKSWDRVIFCRRILEFSGLSCLACGVVFIRSDPLTATLRAGYRGKSCCMICGSCSRVFVGQVAEACTHTSRPGINTASLSHVWPPQLAALSLWLLSCSGQNGTRTPSEEDLLLLVNEWMADRSSGV